MPKPVVPESVPLGEWENGSVRDARLAEDLPSISGVALNDKFTITVTLRGMEAIALRNYLWRMQIRPGDFLKEVVGEKVRAMGLVKRG